LATKSQIPPGFSLIEELGALITDVDGVLNTPSLTWLDEIVAKITDASPKIAVRLGRIAERMKPNLYLFHLINTLPSDLRICVVSGRIESLEAQTRSFFHRHLSKPRPDTEFYLRQVGKTPMEHKIEVVKRIADEIRPRKILLVDDNLLVLDAITKRFLTVQAVHPFELPKLF